MMTEQNATEKMQLSANSLKSVFELFFICVSLFAALVVVNFMRSPNFSYQTLFKAILPLCALLLFAFVIFRFIKKGLMDKVVDDGKSLTLYCGKEKEVVPYEKILEVDYELLRPNRAILRFAYKTKFGDQVYFWPKIRLSEFPMFRNKIVEELSERIALKNVKPESLKERYLHSD